MSITQVRMLGILRDHEPGILELARALGLEKSSVTGLVDRAEKRGLVTRTAAEHDGRAVHVVLTPAGKKLAAQGAREAQSELAALAEGLSARDQAQLSRLAGRLTGDRAA